MIYFDDLNPVENPRGIDAVLANCQDDYNRGYRQLKLKIGRGHRWFPGEQGLQRDIEVTKKVLEAFPDTDILVDGNNGFTVDGIIDYLKGVEDVPLWWVEEPFSETKADCLKLKRWLVENRRSGTLYADGEWGPDDNLMMDLGRSEIIDVYLNDIELAGMTTWVKLMPELVKNRLLASPHNWGNFLKTIYTGHLAGAFGNVCTNEGVTCLSGEIDFGMNRVEKGSFYPSPEPGFGMKLLV